MTISPERMIQFIRPPQTKDELWHFVQAIFGVEIPRLKICPDHDAPFDAFCEGYFGNRSNWVLWYGSRGTGKSLLLATLALTKAYAMDLSVVLLGGSMAQSQNVHEHVERLMRWPNAPKEPYDIARQIKTELLFTLGNWVRPIPASQTTVRGPHPELLCLDEIDEMERSIYDASMGQALAKDNARGVPVQEMTVASSTWQNPEGTFSQVRDEALQKGLPIRTWCYKEVLRTEENPTGWMDPEFIERKRQSVPAEMFRVEFDLGEPSGEARAFDVTKLNDAFITMVPVDETHHGTDDTWVYAEPEVNGSYAVGADWAKERDMTVISVVRTDLYPRQVVYARRMNRKPWPEMIEAFNWAVNHYNAAVSSHDATGIGNVVHDLIDERTVKVVMVGRDRTLLLNEYVAAVEKGDYLLPRDTPMHWAHKAASVNDLYATGVATRYHLPDDVAAMAICHRAATRQVGPAGPGGVPRTELKPPLTRPLEPDYSDVPWIGVEGVVEVKDNEDTVGVFWL
jgi:hypothetical protein